MYRRPIAESDVFGGVGFLLQPSCLFGLFRRRLHDLLRLRLFLSVALARSATLWLFSLFFFSQCAEVAQVQEKGEDPAGQDHRATHDEEVMVVVVDVHQEPWVWKSTLGINENISGKNSNKKNYILVTCFISWSCSLDLIKLKRNT